MSTPAPDADLTRLFRDVPGAIPLYRAFETRVLAQHPAASLRVQKTQVTFVNPRVFACASLLRARRKALLPDPYLTITLGLAHRLDSPRVDQASEPYPGRWTHHLVIGSIDEIDDELMAWTAEAYRFAERK